MSRSVEPKPGASLALIEVGVLELRRRLADSLPPRARGWHALMMLVQDLDALEREASVSPAARQEVLLLSFEAARGAILLRLKRELSGLPEEDLEEIFQSVWLEIDALYARCQERDRFSAYLWTVIRRRGLDRAERLSRSSQEEDQAAPEAASDPSIAAQALRRFAWYHWGSQDHPHAESGEAVSQRQLRALMVEFTALSCGLEGRPYGDLVFWNQPRTGEWGPGTGEEDEKWWRNRATYARGKFKKILQTSEGREAYQRILEEMNGVVKLRRHR